MEIHNFPCVCENATIKKNILLGAFLKILLHSLMFICWYFTYSSVDNVSPFVA